MRAGVSLSVAARTAELRSRSGILTQPSTQHLDLQPSHDVYDLVANRGFVVDRVDQRIDGSPRGLGCLGLGPRGVP